MKWGDLYVAQLPWYFLTKKDGRMYFLQGRHKEGLEHRVAVVHGRVCMAVRQECLLMHEMRGNKAREPHRWGSVKWGSVKFKQESHSKQ